MKNIIRLTEELIRFRTEAGKKEEIARAFSFIESSIKKKLGPDVAVRIEEHNGSLSLYAPASDQRREYVLLNGHIDVIPAEDAQYEPRISDGRLYGRGAGDMKSGVATLIELFCEHYTKGDVALLLNSDEEIGGFDGAAVYAERLTPSLVLITEPTENRMCLAEKGGLWIDIELTGPGGHASRPWKAKNSIDELIGLLGDLRKEFPRPLQDSWTDTMNIGAIRGGKLSVVPSGIANGPANSIADNASARLDIRLTEKTTSAEVIARIDNLLERKRRELGEGYRVERRVVEIVSHLTTREDDPHVRGMITAYERRFGKRPQMVKEHGASDGRFFSAKGVPVILFGPVSVGHHSKEEYAEISSIEKMYEALDAYLESLE